MDTFPGAPSEVLHVDDHARRAEGSRRYSAVTHDPPRIGVGLVIALVFSAVCLQTGWGSLPSANASGVPSAAPPPAPLPLPTRSFDLAKLARQVHFSYRSRATGGFTGGDSTYSVQVDQDGGFVFQPMEPKPARSARGVTRVAPDRDLRGTSALEGAKAAPARFTTVAIGGALDPSTVALLPDGGVGITRGPVVESLRNSEGGVEQSWTFAERPAGGEDLVIRVAVSGHEYVTATAMGLHFIDRRTGLGVRYGLATWVDARGARTLVTPTFEAGHIVLRVPAALVEHSSYPAVLDPAISSEFGTDVPVIRAVEAFLLGSPSMGFDGTHYLVTWMDFRDADHGGIWAAHVAPNGSIVETTGIALSHDAFSNFGPAPVACDGSNCLVVWNSDDANFVEEIHGQLVSKVGAATYPLNGRSSDNPIVISKTGIYGGTFNPSVGFNGTRYLVAWSERDTNTIRGARVSTDGAVLDSVASGIPIAPFGENPQIASDGNSFLVVSAGPLAASIRGVVVDTNGQAYAPVTIRAGSATAPAVAWGETSYIVTWTDYRATPPGEASTNSDIFARSASSGFSPILGAEFQVTTDLSNQTDSAIACHAATCLVTWIDWRNQPAGSLKYDVFAHELTASGLSGAELALTSGVPSTLDTPGVASDGTNFAVAYSNGSNGSQNQIHMLGVGGASPFADELITQSANNQTAPASAFDGTHWLVVWEDNRGVVGGRNILGALVNRDGTLFTGVFNVSSSNGHNVAPSVAFNGTHYLVAWSDFLNETIVGAVVDTAGTVSLADTPIAQRGSPPDFAPSSPNVASDGVNFLVTWQVGSSDEFPSGIRARRLDATLASLDSVIIHVYESPNGVDGMSPKAAYDGTAGNYLVTFVDIPSTTGRDILAQRVRATDGALGGVITISDAADAQQAPSVAFDGTSFVVAWRDSRNFPVTLIGEIYAAVVSPTGVVSSATPIATGGDKQFPTVHFDGTHTLIAWTDTGPDNLMVARYTAGLTPDGAPLLVSPGGSFTGVSLATGSGRTLMAYSQFELAANLGSYRVRGRFAINDTTPPVLTVPTSITVNATSAAGAVVTYSATATDNVDGTLPVSCSPPSGSLFPIGTMTVHCSAMDAAGNPASASFPVIVVGSTAQLTSLITVVNNLGLAQGLRNSLVVKLQAAMDAINAGQTATACGKLNDFISAVNAQTGKGIPTAKASLLITGAMEIKGAIGCS